MEDNLAKYVLEYKKDNNLIQEEFISTNSLKQKIKDLNLRAFQISEKLLIGKNIGWQSNLCSELINLSYKWPRRFQFLLTFIEELSKLENRTFKNKEYIDYYFLFNCLDTINYILISTPLQELDKKIIQFLNTINRIVHDDIINDFNAEEENWKKIDEYYNDPFNY